MCVNNIYVYAHICRVCPCVWVVSLQLGCKDLGRDEAICVYIYIYIYICISYICIYKSYICICIHTNMCVNNIYVYAHICRVCPCVEALSPQLCRENLGRDEVLMK